MPKQSLAYRELSLPLTPTFSPPQRPSSYSRGLSCRNRTQFNPTHSSSKTEEGPDNQSFWKKNTAYYSSIRKDDMLRMLKGKNYLLSCHEQNQKMVRDASLKKVWRSEFKNMTVSTQNYSFMRVGQVRKTKFKGKRLLTMDRQRVQNQKNFLVRNLRIEKWLTHPEDRIL